MGQNFFLKKLEATTKNIVFYVKNQKEKDRKLLMEMFLTFQKQQLEKLSKELKLVAQYVLGMKQGVTFIIFCQKKMGVRIH